VTLGVPVCDTLVDSVADAVSVALDVTELETLCTEGLEGEGKDVGAMQMAGRKRVR